MNLRRQQGEHKLKRMEEQENGRCDKGRERAAEAQRKVHTCNGDTSGGFLVRVGQSGGLCDG